MKIAAALAASAAVLSPAEAFAPAASIAPSTRPVATRLDLAFDPAALSSAVEATQSFASLFQSAVEASSFLTSYVSSAVDGAQGGEALGQMALAGPVGLSVALGGMKSARGDFKYEYRAGSGYATSSEPVVEEVVEEVVVVEKPVAPPKPVVVMKVEEPAPVAVEVEEPTKRRSKRKLVRGVAVLVAAGAVTAVKTIVRSYLGGGLLPVA